MSNEKLSSRDEKKATTTHFFIGEASDAEEEQPLGDRLKPHKEKFTPCFGGVKTFFWTCQVFIFGEKHLDAFETIWTNLSVKQDGKTSKKIWKHLGEVRQLLACAG